MNKHWHDKLPIYKQLVIKLKQSIIDGSFAEEKALPSVRVVSAELNINHITVSKAYHELLDDNLIEKKRGLGMFVLKGALNQLLESERTVFLQEELPQLITRIHQLNIAPEEVIQHLQKITGKHKSIKE